MTRPRSDTSARRPGPRPSSAPTGIPDAADLCRRPGRGRDPDGRADLHHARRARPPRPRRRRRRRRASARRRHRDDRRAGRRRDRRRRPVPRHPRDPARGRRGRHRPGSRSSSARSPPPRWPQAVDLGSAAVKIFPAGRLGPDYLSDLHGPFPNVDLLPSGGINAGNAAPLPRRRRAGRLRGHQRRPTGGGRRWRLDRHHRPGTSIRRRASTDPLSPDPPTAPGDDMTVVRRLAAARHSRAAHARRASASPCCCS